MSDNFIPLNQSTPVQGQQKNMYKTQHYNKKRRGGYNNWRNGSRSSYGSNSSNNSYGQERQNIDAFLHPSMLQDPWAALRRKNELNMKDTNNQMNANSSSST